MFSARPRARRNDLDTDERRATINGEEGPPSIPPRRDALSGSRHIVYPGRNCAWHVDVIFSVPILFVDMALISLLVPAKPQTSPPSWEAPVTPSKYPSEGAVN